MYLIELGSNFQLVVVLPRCKKTQFKLKLNKTKPHKANQKLMQTSCLQENLCYLCSAQ